MDRKGEQDLNREPGKLAKVDQLRFHRLIQMNPFFASHVMKQLVERIRSMDRLLAEKS